MQTSIEFRTVFGTNSKMFSIDDEDRNLALLDMFERFANDKLQARGHLFLNEVLDMLGLPRVRIGQAVGWVWTTGLKTPVSFGRQAIIVGRQEPITLIINAKHYIADLVWGEI